MEVEGVEKDFDSTLINLGFTLTQHSFRAFLNVILP
jgi:hypothetical protein